MVTRDELRALIQQHGVANVADMITNGFVVAGLRDGIDLIAWQVKQAPGALLFFRVVDDAVTDRILWVNAPESERAKWQQIIDDEGDDGVLLLGNAR